MFKLYWNLRCCFGPFLTQTFYFSKSKHIHRWRSSMLPLSNKLKIKKIVQLVVEILAKESTFVCKILNVWLPWKYCMTPLAYIHFKHIQYVMKFTCCFGPLLTQTNYFSKSKHIHSWRSMLPLLISQKSTKLSG